MLRYHHHPMLGTDVTVAVDGVEPRVADRIDRAITAEIERLEAILTAFDPNSEFERWKRGEVRRPSVELTSVLSAGLDWQVQSAGAFNPLVDEIAALWRESERIGAAPQPAELAAAAKKVAAPRIVVDGDGQVATTGDVSALRFHAFAKGWIVDRAIQAGVDAVGSTDVARLNIVVNAGGDLAHRGLAAQPVAIANPLSRFDNIPPIDRVMLLNAGLATSGRSRQGFDVGGRHFSHVIDPRTGQPVDLHASISVVASDAATADALTTIAGVCPVPDAIEVADAYDAACLVVGLDGSLTSNERWDELRPASAG